MRIYNSINKLFTAVIATLFFCILSLNMLSHEELDYAYNMNNLGRITEEQPVQRPLVKMQ